MAMQDDISEIKKDIREILTMLSDGKAKMAVHKEKIETLEDNHSGLITKLWGLFILFLGLTAKAAYDFFKVK